MKRVFRYTRFTGAISILLLLISGPLSASSDNDLYNGIIPLSEIYEKLGVLPDSGHGQGRHGCPIPKDFEPFERFSYLDFRLSA
jgi:hypothetical protein